MPAPRPGISLQAQGVTILGLRELEAILTPPDELLAGPWKRAMAYLAQSAVPEIKAMAPEGKTRLLRGKIWAKVQNQPFPKWLAIRARAVRKSRKYPKGYPYPRLLQYAPKYGHHLWFDRGVTPLLSRAGDALNQAAREIEQKWTRS